MSNERSIDVTFRPVTEAEACAIAAWRYDGPYAIYNAPEGAAGDPEYLRELLDPDNPYYAGIDSQGGLIGFLGFGAPAQVGTAEEREEAYGGEEALDVGLGLRPDLTGRGRGLAFVEAGLAFAREQFAPARFRLSVAAFNQRAIRVYERAGFRRVRAMTLASSGGPREFIIMVRDAWAG
jgi:[ribosomal protein S18]-alanine N-acetyltransferase